MKTIYRPFPPYDDDALLEVIDLADIPIPEEDKRIKIEQPAQMWLNTTSGGLVKIFKDGRIEGDAIGTVRQLCCQFQQDTTDLHKKFGTKVTPTQIISLLTQNPSGETRDANYFFWRDQKDEKYYQIKAKEGLAWWISATHENYYYLPETSRLRLEFKCAHSYTKYNSTSLYKTHGDLDEMPASIGDLLLYVNPTSSQVFWYCPVCSQKAHKGVRHLMDDRDLRRELELDGIIPERKFKYEDRMSQIDDILEFIGQNEGTSFYWVDKELGLPSGTSQRIINKDLKDRVTIRKKRGGKGYVLSKTQKKQ